jgi:hypothetical protein
MDRIARLLTSLDLGLFVVAYRWLGLLQRLFYFPGKKESYQASISRTFEENRLPPDIDGQRKALFEVVTRQGNERTVVSS